MKTNFDIVSYLDQIGLPKQYAGDLLILALYVIAGIIIVFLVKKKNLGAFMMSSYVAYAIFSFSYFIPKNVTAGILYFVFLLIGIFFMMKKIVAFHIGGGNLAIMIKSIIIALMALGINTSLILSWLPMESLEFFTPFTKQAFTSDLFRLAWTVVPFLILAFMKKYRY